LVEIFSPMLTAIRRPDSAPISRARYWCIPLTLA
jgi:hypothetical protein